MTVHAIDMPDVFAGGEPRRVLWDDETGEVSGEHSQVPDIRDTMDRAERDGVLPHIAGHWKLRDPRRDPRDFLVVLFWTGCPPLDLPDWIPPALRVEPTPFILNDIGDEVA